MHDELCRKCGGMLTNWSLCSECRKPVKRICLQCGIHTEEVVHNLCFYHVDSIQVAASGLERGGIAKNGKRPFLEENAHDQLLREIS